MNREHTNLEDLLNCIQNVDGDGEEITIGDILDKIGRRSFGPIVLISGLITLAPVVGDIPGVPTIMGLIVLLTAGQLLFQHDHFWLPGWLLSRSMDKNKIENAVEWMRSTATFIDRWSRPRLKGFVDGIGIYAMAAVCVVVAAAMPVMEFVPFSANGAGLVLTTFGLALITHDGLLALIALIFAVSTFGLIIYSVM